MVKYVAITSHDVLKFAVEIPSPNAKSKVPDMRIGFMIIMLRHLGYRS